MRSIDWAWAFQAQAFLANHSIMWGFQEWIWLSGITDEAGDPVLIDPASPVDSIRPETQRYSHKFWLDE